MNEAFVYDVVRTPRGRGKKDGALHAIRPVDLARQVLAAVRERNRLDTAQVEDVILGCVTAIGEQGGNVAKTAALFAGYAETVGGVTVNRFCGSGLEAVNQAAARVRAGSDDLFVAGGVESMSRIPIGSDGGAWAVDPEVATLTHFVPQGISADLIATLEGYTREDVDGFAVASQRRAAEALGEDRFARSLVPVVDLDGEVVLGRDEHPRPETTAEGLAKLEPSFARAGREGGFDAVAVERYPVLEEVRHVHHAGNSSGIVDGAAAVLLGSAAAGRRAGLTPRARVVSWAVTSTDPTTMLTGPSPASRKALAAAGLAADAIDLFEVNEAFAAVVLHFMDEMGVPHAKVNVNGGAIAFGHPLGATGAMLLGTLLDELERRGARYGLTTLCIGGGQGIATVVERL
ncbi:MAG TPA: acetyl-CoA C-acetyltransferase [Candidatus Polarisedimenticolaceae bacterium]|nr:acetyl-CoA C-acetyltransferase [Candidatus Polarisedimenticolaceae bacterium]